jgi:hypothetical protein
MKTLGDIVLEHAKKKASSTGDGIEFLGLRHIPENFQAGNTYLAALNIINDLIEKLNQLYKVMQRT